MINNVLLIFSAVSFLFFGIGCLRSPHLIAEFERYGVPQFRTLTGLLQLLGGLGILLGFYWSPLQIFSCFGLSLLMLFGVGVRVKIKDSFIQSFPAAFYCLLNSYLFWLLL
jgi:uncharacterized membrane protein YphA (DoxX/SURF4 family)